MSINTTLQGNRTSRSATSRRLLPFAKRYVWWKTPEEAIQYPNRVIAAVMDKGDWKDVIALEEAVGHEAMKEALHLASVGEFRAKSWHFWHKRLYDAHANVPPQKKARF